MIVLLRLILVVVVAGAFATSSLRIPFEVNLDGRMVNATIPSLFQEDVLQMELAFSHSTECRVRGPSVGRQRDHWFVAALIELHGSENENLDVMEDLLLINRVDQGTNETLLSFIDGNLGISGDGALVRQGSSVTLARNSENPDLGGFLILGQTQSAFESTNCVPNTVIHLDYSEGDSLAVSVSFLVGLFQRDFQSLLLQLKDSNFLVQMPIDMMVPIGEVLNATTTDLVNINTPFTFGNCQHARTILPTIRIEFVDYGTVNLYPQDYTKEVGSDRCDLLARSHPAFHIELSILNIQGMNLRIDQDEISLCDTL